jgi:hypothetical protein
VAKEPGSEILSPGGAAIACGPPCVYLSLAATEYDIEESPDVRDLDDVGRLRIDYGTYDSRQIGALVRIQRSRH